MVWPLHLFEVVCPDGNFGFHHVCVVSLELLHPLYLWLDERNEEAFAIILKKSFSCNAWHLFFVYIGERP